MKYKILSSVLGVMCIILFINYYRMDKFIKSMGKNRSNAETERLHDLNMEKESWQKQLDELTKKNNALSAENNIHHD